MISLGKSLKNGQKKDPGKYIKNARPAKKSDLKSIDPIVFYEKNVILQDRHKNCRILVVIKFKKRANSMSRFSVYLHSGRYYRIVLVHMKGWRIENGE